MFLALSVFLTCKWMHVGVHGEGGICRSVPVASHLAYDILSGLAYMNSLGLVHRNLAPSNVLFDHQVLCNAVLSDAVFVNFISVWSLGKLLTAVQTVCGYCLCLCMTHNCIWRVKHYYITVVLLDRAFAVAGPRVWNSLPPAIRDPSLSPSVFGKLLKTYLFV